VGDRINCAELDICLLFLYTYFRENLGTVFRMKGVFCFIKQLVSSVIVFKFCLESVNAVQQLKD